MGGYGNANDEEEALCFGRDGRNVVRCSPLLTTKELVQDTTVSIGHRPPAEVSRPMRRESLRSNKPFAPAAAAAVGFNMPSNIALSASGFNQNDHHVIGGAAEEGEEEDPLRKYAALPRLPSDPSLLHSSNVKGHRPPTAVRLSAAIVAPAAVVLPGASAAGADGWGGGLGRLAIAGGQQLRCGL